MTPAKNSTEDTSIDAQLSLLEARIRDLKFDYDRYFTKDIKLEPVRKREDVERMILRLSKMQFLKVSHRFTYENIISRFISLKTYWDKRLRMLEAGLAKRTGEPAPVPPVEEPDSYHRVYDDYVRLITSLNPSASVTSYESIRKTLESKRDELIAQYKCREIEFKVEYDNKKLKFKAVPKY